MIAGLNQIIALSDPSKAKGRTYIIPGHGRLCDREDVIKYRDMSVILQKRVQEMTYSKEGRRAIDTPAAVTVLRTYSPK